MFRFLIGDQQALDIFARQKFRANFCTLAFTRSWWYWPKVRSGAWLFLTELESRIVSDRQYPALNGLAGGSRCLAHDQIAGRGATHSE
jgi:hypothetical protein